MHKCGHCLNLSNLVLYLADICGRYLWNVLDVGFKCFRSHIYRFENGHPPQKDNFKKYITDYIGAYGESQSGNTENANPEGVVDENKDNKIIYGIPRKNKKQRPSSTVIQYRSEKSTTSDYEEVYVVKDAAKVITNSSKGRLP